MNSTQNMRYERDNQHKRRESTYWKPNKIVSSWIEQGRDTFQLFNQFKDISFCSVERCGYLMDYLDLDLYKFWPKV